MKNLTPEQRAEIVRILKGIRADLDELRETFERVRARLDAQAGGQQPRG
jgi:hypothetical protein